MDKEREIKLEERFAKEFDTFRIDGLKSKAETEKQLRKFIHRWKKITSKAEIDYIATLYFSKKIYESIMLYNRECPRKDLISHMCSLFIGYEESYFNMIIDKLVRVNKLEIVNGDMLKRV